MAVLTYDPAATMREARAAYFAANRFGDDGGYGDAWVDFKLGPVPFPFPNAPARVKAVRYHDLHHIVTGYDTDNRGEYEISAWEIAAGCRGFAAAWIINLGGMVAGLLTSPGRTFRAFVRGRRMRSLYDGDVDVLLGQTVAATRAAVTCGDERAPVTASDVARFTAATAAGVVVGAVLLVTLVPLVPVGVVMNALRRRARAVAH